jgi:hypothetical protein
MSLKCRDCFVQKLPPKGSTTTLTPEEQVEEVHITLAQSRDAVSVYDGVAVCADHLAERVYAA